MKQVQRLLMFQGNRCFFCHGEIPEGQESVEHLVAKARGGKDNDENCVACCKEVNSAFADFSYKFKLQVVINQRGEFKCPMKSAALAESTNGMEELIEIERKSTAEAEFKEINGLLYTINFLLINKQNRPAKFNKLLNFIRTNVAQAAGLELDIQECVSIAKSLEKRSCISVSSSDIKYHHGNLQKTKEKLSKLIQIESEPSELAKEEGRGEDLQADDMGAFGAMFVINEMDMPAINGSQSLNS